MDDDPIYRHPPVMAGIEWHRAFNFHDAIHLIDRNEYAIISLDHDIASFYGNREMTGDDVLQYLIARKIETGDGPPTVRIHTANSVKVKRMWEDANRYFNNPA